MNEIRTESLTPEAMRAKEEYLYNAGRNSAITEEGLRRPQLFTDQYGKQYIYCNGKYEEVELDKPEHIVNGDVFRSFTLDGLIDYIQMDPDELFKDEKMRHIVQVQDPETVVVMTQTIGYWKERELIAACKAVIPDIRFGRYMDAEEFQIMVQTSFQESENRALVLKLAGSIRKEQNMQTADDGVSQKVTINSGVSTASDVIVRNPVTLTPYRTFHEVQQPESPFVLRFNEEGDAALFTGDGSKWKLEAVENIKKYLAEKLDGYNVDVIG